MNSLNNRSNAKKDELNSSVTESDIVSITSSKKQRLRFLSKLPFFNKLAKTSNNRQDDRLKLFKIYKFADKIDIFLMIIGIAAVLGTSVCNVMLYYFTRQALDNIGHVGNSSGEMTSVNQSTVNSSACNGIASSNEDITKSPFDAIQLLSKYYAIAGLINFLLHWMAWSTWMSTAERQLRRIRYKLFRNILCQEIGWFDVHNAGELNNRLSTDLDKIRNGLNEKVPSFVALIARTIGVLMYALIIGWKLTLVSLSVSPLLILTYRMTSAVIVKYSAAETKAYDIASSVAEEILGNIRTVTSFHGQQKEEERYHQNLSSVKKIGIRKSMYIGLCEGLGQLFNFLSFTMTFWYGSRLVQTECQIYTPGTLIVIFVACLTSMGITTQVTPALRVFAEALVSGRFVFDIIERKSNIDVSNDEGEKPEGIKGDIEFENVTFSYPTRQKSDTVNNLSMKITAGQTIALVGASGCGKSTIIQLIQRFYDPNNGRILIDGNDIKTLNVAWLRSHIGIVSQEPVLFTGSIEDNIRLGKLSATDEEVIAAAKIANAHNFIMDFPDNYKTLSGNKLSGGEKQRVVIARTLISNPKILLLDEATSALDYANERLVQDALDKAKQGRTTITIAHRLNTIRNADLIIGLDNGQVIEYGTHDELLEKKGLYYVLLTEQGENEEHESVTKIDTNERLKTKLGFAQRLLAIRKKVTKLNNIIEDKENDEDEVSSNDCTELKEKNHFCSFFLFRILKFNKPEWYWIVIGSIASLIFGALQPAFTYSYSEIYGLVFHSNDNEQKRLIQLYIIGIASTGVVAAVSQFILNLTFGKSGEELTARMRMLTMSSLLRQEMSYFDMKENSSETLITRLASDTSAIKDLTGMYIGNLIQGYSAVSIALIIGLISSWKLTLVVSCFLPLLFLLNKLQSGRQYRTKKMKDQNLYNEIGEQCAFQAIEHIRTVVALHREDHFIDIYENAFDQEFKKDMCHLYIVALSAAITSSLRFFIHAVNFSYGSTLVQKGEMSFENVYKVYAVIVITTTRMGRLTGETLNYSKAKTAALRIVKLIKRQSQIDPYDSSGIILKNIACNIQFKNISFRYPARRNVRIFKDFSLKCTTNGTTALVGPSGSGKSTVIDLLQRFYDPLEGQVLFDGHDIQTLNIQWFRSLMGLVQQEPVLFNRSIRDNIAYGDNSREVTQQEIEAVAQIANIHHLIISLPEGYDTLCGTKGEHLSVGQKQRIAIARALIRSPNILLLDEATSALDNNNEMAVQQALDDAKSNRTCLTVAHRLLTIRNADKIVVIEKGEVKEEGTHNDLLKLNGFYSKIVMSQEKSILNEIY